MNDEFSIVYIQHFDKYTKDKTVDAWRIFLSDEYGFHLYHDFIEYCWEYKIIPFSLSLHNTHLMQPLDVVYFQSVKHYYRKAIDKAVRLGAIKFPLVEFFSAFEYIRAQIFKREIIISAFE
jgi:hypothetical protein